MSPTVCAEVQNSFSGYLDGAVSGVEMQRIAGHIHGIRGIGACADCARELSAWQAAQQALAVLGPARAPANLGLKLRLAISREQARRSTPWLDRISLMWDNGLRPALFQVSAGTAAALLMVGSILFLLGMVAAPRSVLANDEPLGGITAPHYLYSTVAPATIAMGRETAIVVEAKVDSTGRVYDYQIVSGPQDGAIRIQIERQLLGSVFQPASVFGAPVRGHVVVTFSGISVHG